MVQKLFTPRPERGPDSLEELVQKLQKMFEAEQVDIESVKNLMASYKSNPEDWARFARFDPSRFVFEK